jgi:hypothetical protein
MFDDNQEVAVEWSKKGKPVKWWDAIIEGYEDAKYTVKYVNDKRVEYDVMVKRITLRGDAGEARG